MKLQLKKWDTLFFGFNVYDLEFESLQEFNTSVSIDTNDIFPGSLIQAKIPINEKNTTNVLLNAGFSIQDTAVTLKKPQQRLTRLNLSIC